jgi:hypothetical protein
MQDRLVVTSFSVFADRARDGNKTLTRKAPSETNCCANEGMVEELEWVIFAVLFMAVVESLLASSGGNA